MFLAKVLIFDHEYCLVLRLYRVLCEDNLPVISMKRGVEFTINRNQITVLFRVLRIFVYNAHPLLTRK